MSAAEDEYGPIEYSCSGARYAAPWSLDFLTMAGFSHSAAMRVWNKWQQVDRDFPEFHVYLQTAANECLKAAAYAHDAHGPDDDYAAAWLDMGIEPDLLPQLMSDKHRPIRLMTSASSAFLASVEATADYWHRSNTRWRADCRRPGQGHFEVDLPSGMEGHTMLYKAGTVFDLSRIWHPPGAGRICLHALSSQAPTDLDRKDTDMVYTFSQLEIAELTCSYKASFARHVPFAILHIAMPDYMLTPQNGFIHITDHRHWQRIVWASRARYHGTIRTWKLPEDLQHCTQRTRFGAAAKICGQSTGVLTRLDNPRHIKALVLNDGTEAMHYAFMYDSYDGLIDECDGKVWLEERNLNADQKEVMPASGKAWFRPAMP